MAISSYRQLVCVHFIKLKLGEFNASSSGRQEGGEEKTKIEDVPEGG